VHLYIPCKHTSIFCQHMHFLVFPLQLRQTCRSNSRNVRLCTVYVRYVLLNHFTKVNMTNVGWQVDSKVHYKGDNENTIRGILADYRENRRTLHWHFWRVASSNHEFEVGEVLILSPL
jgi:hypothetical protein